MGEIHRSGIASYPSSSCLSKLLDSKNKELGIKIKCKSLRSQDFEFAPMKELSHHAYLPFHYDPRQFWRRKFLNSYILFFSCPSGKRLHLIGSVKQLLVAVETKEHVEHVINQHDHSSGLEVVVGEDILGNRRVELCAATTVID